MSEEKFSKCEEGKKKCKCRISGVRKERIERKVQGEKKKIKVIWGGNFTKFVFTGWTMLICKLKFYVARRKKMN